MTGQRSRHKDPRDAQATTAYLVNMSENRRGPQNSSHAHESAAGPLPRRLHVTYDRGTTKWQNVG